MGATEDELEVNVTFKKCFFVCLKMSITVLSPPDLPQLKPTPTPTLVEGEGHVYRSNSPIMLANLTLIKDVQMLLLSNRSNLFKFTLVSL